MGGAEPRQFGLGGVGAGLERVDPLQQAGEQAGRVAADLAGFAHRQLVEAVEQHRQALGAADDAEEGVEPRGLGVLAQEALGGRLPGPDPELLIGAVEQRLDPPLRRWAVARVEVMTMTRSGPRPSSASRATRRASTSVLPDPGAPTSSSGPFSQAIARCCGGVKSIAQR